MKNKQTLIVVDFETGSADERTCEPIQIAAVAINPSSLEIDYAGAFESLMKPYDFDALEDDALKINGKTKEMLMKAPERSIVWKDFAAWVKPFNFAKKFWSAPIFCGYFSDNFDWPIYDRLCHEFGNVDSDGRPNLFSTYMKIDVSRTLWNWFESSNDLPKYKLDVVRDYFGMSKEGAHDAKVDVFQTAEIMVRFLNFQRGLMKVHGSKFKGCFSK